MSQTRINAVGLAAAFGAGLASALLALMPALKGGFAAGGGSVTTIGASAWGVAFIAPLPIMLASLSFGSLSGLLAAVVGALAVGIVDLRGDLLSGLHFDKIAASGLETLVFAVCFGIPSWLLARLAVMPAAARRTEDKALLRPEERRLGMVIAVAAGFAAVGAAIEIAILADARGSFHALIETSTKAFEPMVTRRGPLPQGWDAHAMATVLAWSLLAMMAAGQLLLVTINLWVAARVAQASSLLSTPWPDIPRGLRVPRPLALVLAVALGLSFAGNQFGALGVVVSGALGMAFALQGLAVLHAVTRGNPGLRLPLLTLAYIIFVVMMPWSIVPFGLLGLLDTAFSFRDRQKPIVKKTR